jgi:hypothetical protein
MADVPPMSAGKLGDPGALFVLMETDDRTLHCFQGTPDRRVGR